jgi:hypothetical protein
VPSQINLTVSSLADSGPGTLRDAIQTANDPVSHSDQFTIDFALTGTIDLQSPLPALNNSIAIQGPGAASLTVERAAGVPFASAIVTVDAGQTASLSGLTIANGNDGGIANEAGGTLTISGCTISGNNSGGDGGGIWSAGTLSLTNCTVSGNFAFLGGGIFNDGGSVTIQQNSTVSGNTAVFGGGILNGGTLTVRDSTLSGNHAIGFDLPGRHIVGQGGGIFDGTGGSTTLDGCTVSDNTAELGGGIYNRGMLDARGSAFLGNTASDSGGGLYNIFGTATLQESTVSGNSAGSNGGGIFNDITATLSIDDSVVQHNHALLGDDFYNLGNASVNDSTVGLSGP